MHPALRILVIAVFALVALQLSTVKAATSAETCYDVHRGDFYPTPLVPFEFDNSTERSTAVTFRPNASAYKCTGCPAEPAGCQSNWNKLWGKGRCGYFTLHHIDSDRFAWRRNLAMDDQIEIAAYRCAVCLHFAQFALEF